MTSRQNKRLCPDKTLHAASSFTRFQLLLVLFGEQSSSATFILL